MAVTGARAAAADKPVFAPAPAWVVPAAMPATSAGDTEGAVRFLLNDQQVWLEPGRQTSYVDVAFKIQTPQGLAAGNLSIPWRPESDTLTVHRLAIRRDSEVIDVLAAGQTFTIVRREANLENAVLDGVLTATIQPEGLRVGDILEFAFSTTSSDPVLKGHVEQIAAANWNGLPIGRAHLRIQWPSSLPVRIRDAAGLPPLKPRKTGGMTSAEISVDNLQPYNAPKGAPARFGTGRIAEFTDFTSWSELSALLAPLYATASALPTEGALKAEVAKLRAVSPDPKQRAEAALALVQDRVRYVALAMGTGGQVPADVETTWSRRFGDCKGKTALLLALLGALDIAAEPVIVSSRFGDGLDQRLPMLALFDHVLVRATIAGRSYWLDGTRTGDTSLDRLKVPGFGWGLPLIASGKNGGGVLVRMLPPPLDEPSEATTITIDATAGLTVPAPTKIELVYRGDEAVASNMSLANLTPDARDRSLRDFWKRQYDFIEVANTASRFDAERGELRLSMTGTARMDWDSGQYETDGMQVGFKADFSRDPGPDRDAPFAVAYPYYIRNVETILLPKGFVGTKLGDGVTVDQTVAGIAYKRIARIIGNVFTIEKIERSLFPEFAASEAPEAQKTLRDLADSGAFLRRPRSYRPTEAEIAAQLASVPKNAGAFIDRGLLLLDRRQYDAAIADFDRAVALAPADAWAIANRALARVWKGNLKVAAVDIDAALAIDPRNPVAFRARGLAALKQNDATGGIAAFTTALTIEPRDSFSLGYRASAYQMAGNSDAAISDASASLAINPDWSELHMLRAQQFLRTNRKDLAIAEAVAVIAAKPDDAEAQAKAGEIYREAGQSAEALRAFDRSLAIKPLATTYAARSLVHPATDTGQRRADLDAALRLDPKSVQVLFARAKSFEIGGDISGAIAAWSQAISAQPDNASLYFSRAELYFGRGDNDNALTDTISAIRLNTAAVDSYLLQANILQRQGKREAAIAVAAAVEIAVPASDYAHVVAANIYHRFGKPDEALRAIDRALAIGPKAYIFLNRAAHRPKTDIAGRRGDFAAALKLEPGLLDAVAAMAGLQIEAGEYDGAVATLTAAIAKAPTNAVLLSRRGVAQLRAGRPALAEQDFSTARAKATDPRTLNELCWQKATAGMALEAALVDCNAALAVMPDNPAILDSRGLVLLRLGRLDDAIKDYDRAIARVPGQSASLYGRAIARARKGDRRKSDADAASATKLAPDIRAEFEGYGVKL